MATASSSAELSEGVAMGSFGSLVVCAQLALVLRYPQGLLSLQRFRFKSLCHSS